MNQDREIYEMAYDSNRGVFTDGSEQVYGAQEYIEDYLGHVIFDDFDIKRVKGYQAQEFIFGNRNSEYHIYVDNKDVDMINMLMGYQKKGGRIKIKTSKDVKQKLKRGYVIAGIASTIVMSGIAYAAGSGMIEDTIDNVQTYMEEAQDEREEREHWNKVAPIYNYLIQVSEEETRSYVSYEPGKKTIIDEESLQEEAKKIYNKIAMEQPEQLYEISSGGVLTPVGIDMVNTIRNDNSLSSESMSK